MVFAMTRPDRRPPQHRLITSLQNPTVKAVRALEMRKVRRETGLFIAEGASVLVTAREHGWGPMLPMATCTVSSSIGRNGPAPKFWK